MTITFNEILFHPVPGSSWTIPIAQVLELPNGSTKVVVSELLPGAACLGGPSRRLLMEYALDCLEDSPLERLTAVLGTSVTIGRVQTVKGTEAQAVALARMMLPSPTNRKDELNDAGVPRPRPRAAQLRTMGYRFLEEVGAHTFVRRTFNAREIEEHQDRLPRIGIEPAAVRDLHDITHWVPGHQRIALMEPISPNRKQFEEDLRDVREKLHAWRDTLRTNEHANGRLEYVAYVLRGGTDAQRKHAQLSLNHACDTVVDLANARLPDRFGKAIREFARGRSKAIARGLVA